MQSGHFCIHSKTRWGRCDENLTLRSGLFGASETELVHSAIFENFPFNCNLAVYFFASHHLDVLMRYDGAMKWMLEVLWNCWTSTIWFFGCNIHKIVLDLIWTMNFTIIIYKCSCSVQSVAKHHIANHQSSFPGHILDLVGTVKFTFWFTCY